MMNPQAILAVLVTATAVGAVTIRYVDDDAPPAGDGLSWQSAHRFLQEALAESGPGSGVTEIRLAGGTYRPDQDEANPDPVYSGSDCCTGHSQGGCDEPECQALVCAVIPNCCNSGPPGGWWDSACIEQAILLCGLACPNIGATFMLPVGLSLRGGYAGIGAPDPDARDLVLFPTILDGGLPLDDGGTRFVGDVLTAVAIGPESVLDGLTIEEAYFFGVACDGSSPTITDCTFRICGFGIRAENRSNPAVTRCRFDDNDVSMSIVDSHPIVTDCDFIGSSTEGVSGDGALITDCRFEDQWIGVSGPSTISGCLFTGNMFCILGAVSVCDSVFIGNGSSAPPDGQGKCIGGIALTSLRDSEFIGNFTPIVVELGQPGSVIERCRFIDNAGGAIHGTTRATVTSCDFVRNVGGIVTSGTSLIANCRFSGNRGILTGGIGINGGSPRLVNCTLIGNARTAGSGAGTAVLVQGGATPTIENCLVWGNGHVPILDLFGAHTAVRDSLVEGGWNGQGSNVLDADPLLEPGPAGGSWTAAAVYDIAHDRTTLTDEGAMFDPSLAGSPIFPSDLLPGFSSVVVEATPTTIRLPSNWSWVAAGAAYQIFGTHLSTGSPCIDAGRNSAILGVVETDLDGDPRFADDPESPDTGCGVPAVVDLGAFEFPGVPGTFVPGDLDGDGSVGDADVAILLSAWGPVGDACDVPDLDQDGVVGIIDLLALLAGWS